MMAERKFSLQQYSSVAGVLLIMHNNTHAQAIYSDIDPDVVLQLHGDVEYIDMDDDGSNDFFIFRFCNQIKKISIYYFCIATLIISHN